MATRGTITELGRSIVRRFERTTPWGLGTSFVLGAIAAVLGLVPWMIQGARLPLQNLWATSPLPEAMPLALLPFSQYALTTIVSLLVTGSVIAGIIDRLGDRLTADPGRRRSGTAALVAGVVVVQAVAVIQTAVTVRGGLETTSTATVYLAALVAGSAASILVGVLLLLLVARAPRAGVVVAVSLAAVPIGSWLTTIIAAPVAFVTAEQAAALSVVRWAPAVVVGLAIAWGGLATIGRWIAAVVALLSLWIAPAVVTAVSSAAGSRVLAPYPAEMLDYGLGVLRSALVVPALAVPPIIVAVVIAAVGIGLRLILARRRSIQPDG